MIRERTINGLNVSPYQLSINDQTDGRGLFSSWVNTIVQGHCMEYAGTEGLGFTGSHVDNVYTGHFSLMST